MIDKEFKSGHYYGYHVFDHIYEYEVFVRVRIPNGLTQIDSYKSCNRVIIKHIKMIRMKELIL